MDPREAFRDLALLGYSDCLLSCLRAAEREVDAYRERDRSEKLDQRSPGLVVCLEPLDPKFSSRNHATRPLHDCDKREYAHREKKRDDEPRPRADLEEVSWQLHAHPLSGRLIENAQ